MTLDEVAAGDTVSVRDGVKVIVDPESAEFIAVFLEPDGMLVLVIAI